MFWQKIRSGIMYVVAFVSCPCHLPITLPLILVLLAGTPAAVWITQHTGWIYGVMTVLFLSTLGMGYWWINQPVNGKCEPRQLNPGDTSGIRTTR